MNAHDSAVTAVPAPTARVFRVLVWVHVVVLCAQLLRLIGDLLGWWHEGPQPTPEQIRSRALMCAFTLCMLSAFGVLASERSRELSPARQRWAAGCIALGVVVLGASLL